MSDQPRRDATRDTHKLRGTMDLTRSTRLERSAQLLLLAAPDRSAPYPFALPFGEITLGRDRLKAEGAGSDATTSERHAVLRATEYGASIEDLGSRNGTFLNGCRLPPHTRHTLQDQDCLRLGETLLIYSTKALPGLVMDSFLPGLTPAVAEARRALKERAHESGPLLLLGETGTGKEYAAKALRAWGRGDARFYALNCSELSGDSARVELFGVQRGAYTDAHVTRDGLIKAAEGGVLFLDEIGELSLSVQAKLLRFLEDRTYRRVGGTETFHSSAFVVAATNRELETAVEAGTFRNDLLARLLATSQPIRLPPLRARRFDITLWIEILLQGLAAELRRTAAGYTPRFVETLLLYDWPHNLRGLNSELSTALRNAGDGKVLDVRHLSDRLQARRRLIRERGDPTRERYGATPRRSASATEIGSYPTLDAPHRELRRTTTGPMTYPPDARRPEESAAPKAAPKATPEEDAILIALTMAKGNMTKASELLEVERTRLYRLCKQLGIDYKHYRS